MKPVPFESFSYPFFDFTYKADHVKLVDAFLNPGYTLPTSKGLKGLYVHIPFCETICRFCPFVKSVGSEERVAQYITALETELRFIGDAERFKSWEIDAIYFGGGTPSVLNNEQITRLFQAIRRNLRLAENCEITFEMEAKSVTREKLLCLKELGTTRVSFGLQTFDPAIRPILNLTPTQEQLEETIALFAEIFPDNNMDMIVGLPGQDEEAMFRDLEKAIASKISSISIYPMDYVMTLPSLLDRIRRKEIPAPPDAPRLKTIEQARGPLRFQRGEAYALVNLGELYLDQGRYEQALTFTEDGLSLARRLKDSYVIHCSLTQLAMIYLLIGDKTTPMLLMAEIEQPEEQGMTISYEYALREITYGTILLYQERYKEAIDLLTKIAGVLETIGLVREQLLVKVRIAAGHLALKQVSAVRSCLNEIAALLAKHKNYEYLVIMEIGRHPQLMQNNLLLPETQWLQHLRYPEKAGSKEEEQSVPSTNSLTTHREEIRIVALGEPTIFVQEQPITRWRMARAIEMFFFLLDCKRAMRKEQIITALWPTVDEQTDHTFHTTLYYLRKALGGECIIAQAGSYALQLAAKYGEVSYDVTAFQQHHATARQALADEDDTRARSELLAMMDLYHGEYVQSFYSDWCSFRRNELRNAYLDARRSLAQIAWRAEAFDEGVIHWQHMLTIDTCQEEAHYGIMRCYARQGKRGLALRQYQHCKEILQQELAVPPGASLQNLYRYLAGTS